ncbi:uncharacterized protein LOC108864089, partial [Galendromus occidentalis]|uniref:Uncharacterized protein LOC108864089 n=1 Tax=Galendromus occidentalis TaxID=34638 RepID=A0AAJ7L5M3_9ACAR
MVDRLARWPEAVPSVASVFIAPWIACFGVPDTITTDQGRQFESRLFNNLCELMHCNRIWTPAYIPRANGATERFHRQLKDAFRCHFAETSWSEFIPLVLLRFRATTKEDIHASPAELVYGQNVTLPPGLKDEPGSVVVDPTDYISVLKEVMSKIKTNTSRPASSPPGFVLCVLCYYTDSRITYHWATLVRPGVWKPFNNRVLEIQKHSNPDQWFFVQGTSNVSDLATRGISVESLINCSDWWFGPSWLRSPRERWPISQPRTESSSFEQVSDETRKVVAPVVLSEPLVDLDRLSTAGRAIRTMGSVLQFIARTRRQTLPEPIELHRRAEAHIVRECQQQFLRQEITDTKAGHRPSSSSKLAAHQLFIDEQNILRVRTRLTGVISTYDQMNPVVIP